MIRDTYVKARKNPRTAYLVAMALLRGGLIKLRYRLRGVNVQIGANFRAYSDLRIQGPGQVVLGDKVSVDLSFLRVPTIITHRSSSRVTIGDGCYLGGVRISCVDSVHIGDEVLMGSTTLIDSDIIPHRGILLNDKWCSEHARPIKVGSYVWAGINSFILGGAVLHDECVLGAGSLIVTKEATEKSLMVGNPARKVGVTR